MNAVGYFAVPIFVMLTVLCGVLKKKPVFQLFTEGAKEGLKSAVNILPTLIALITAISMFKASGALDLLVNFLEPVMEKIGIPSAVLPLALLRPVSGSGAVALTNAIFGEYTPDSMIGKIASVMLGSSETTFYAVAVYFGSVNIKKSGYTVPVALFGDLLVVIFSVITVKYFLP